MEDRELNGEEALNDLGHTDHRVMKNRE